MDTQGARRRIGGRLDRTEIGWPGDRRTIPPEATAIVRGLVRRRDLIQVTELSTIRRRLVLHDAEGSAWAELDDDTVTITHGPRDGRQFRQLEVELLGDHRDGVDAVVSALQRAGGRTGNREKLATALDLKARDPAATNRGREFTGRAVLGEVVQASITSGLGRLLDHDYRLRLDPTNPRPDDIHQARVATRRLRSDLKTLADTLDPIWVNHTRSELRWLGTALGSVRDIDVLSADLGCSTTGTPFEIAGDLAIRARLELQRHKACNELAALLVSSRYLDLLDRLHAASLHPPFLTQAGRRSKRAAAGQPADQALPRLVRIRQKALRRQVGKAGRNPSDHDLHRVRIRAKQLRYASETAAPILGKSARRTAAAAENLQSVLGKHHDAVTAEQWLRRQARAGGRPARRDLPGWTTGIGPPLSTETAGQALETCVEGCLDQEHRPPKAALLIVNGCPRRLGIRSTRAENCTFERLVSCASHPGSSKLRDCPPVFSRAAGGQFSSFLQIEDESEGVIDGVDLIDRRHSSSGDDAFGGDDPNLVAGREVFRPGSNVGASQSPR